MGFGFLFWVMSKLGIQREMVAPVQIKGAKAWEAYVRTVISSDPYALQLLPFHLAWIQKESGGNPAAIGANGAKGPDGYPREIGLYQLYNPDDFTNSGGLGTPAQLRAYCVKSLFRPDAEKLSRAMTESEKAQQVAMGAWLVNRSRKRAEQYLAAVKAGPTWLPEKGPDFWRMAKLVHALPGLAKNGMRATAKKLGRAPLSWAEFRAVVPTLTETEFADSGTWRYHKDFARLLDNAESVGGTVQPLEGKGFV